MSSKIPLELREATYWICWKPEERDGKIVKLPIAPWSTGHDGPASVTDPNNYTTYEKAKKYVKGDVGLGFVFTKDNPFTGIDLDGCIKDDKISELAIEWIKKFNSYTETSPSGKGIHIIVKGKLPRAVKDDKNGIEGYSEGRYFTITGEVSKQTPLEVNERQWQLEELLSRYSGSTEYDVEKALKKAPKIGEHSDDWGLRIATWLRRNGQNKEDAEKTLMEWWRTSPDFKSESNSKDWIHNKIESAYRPTEPYKYYFRQNPTKYQAEGTKVKPKQKQDLPWIMITKTGDLKILTGELGHFILENNNIKTYADTGEILVYKDGIYVNGKSGLETQIQKEIPRGVVKNNHVTEVLGYIRRHTYTKRDIFNLHPGKMCLENGVLDIITYELEAHTPDYLFTIKLPVTYDQAADCPETKKFLADIHHPEDIIVIQEVYGWCLDISQPNDTAIIYHGGGRNGKSTEIHQLETLLGNDNKCNVKLQDLSIPTMASRLYGKMLNTVADLPKKGLQDTGDFKAITGQDYISGKYLYQNPFDFKPYAKLIYSCNQIPRTNDLTDAYFKRIRIINFPNQFIEGADDKNMRKLITTPGELSGVLNWALEGLKRYKDNNQSFSNSPTIDQTREKYIRNSDPLAAFVMDCVQQKTDGYVTKDQFYNSFLSFCKEEKYTPATKIEVGKRIWEHLPYLSEGKVGPKKYQVRCWKGIKLIQYFVGIHDGIHDGQINLDTENDNLDTGTNQCTEKDIGIQGSHDKTLRILTSPSTNSTGAHANSSEDNASIGVTKENKVATLDTVDILSQKKKFSHVLKTIRIIEEMYGSAKLKEIQDKCVDVNNDEIVHILASMCKQGIVYEQKPQCFKVV